MNSTQAVISSASPTRTPANELLSVQQQQTNIKESLYQLPIQRKLSVGAADDPLEKEADDMADKVMRMPNPEPISFSTSKNVINRKCSECEKEEELQRKESNGAPVSTAPSIVQKVLSSAGSSLDTSTRSFMEPRFNYDFSNVKIHDNNIAAKSADSINALAYTSGNNVVFNSGQYNTTSDSGKRLLAHELTHVVQQATDHRSGYLSRQDKANDDCEEGRALRWGCETTCSHNGFIDDGQRDRHDRTKKCCNKWPPFVEKYTRGKLGLNGAASCKFSGGVNHRKNNDIAIVSMGEKSVRVLCTDGFGDAHSHLIELSPAAIIDLSGSLENIRKVKVCYESYDPDNMCTEKLGNNSSPSESDCSTKGCSTAERRRCKDFNWPSN